MTIQVPDQAKTAFAGNIQTGNAVELPFPCPPLFIVNGDMQLDQLGGIHKYGGWAVSLEKLQPTIESYEDRPMPIPGFTQTEVVVNKKDRLKVLAARNVFVSIIGVRQFSTMEVEGKKRKVAPFTKGARPGIQVLSILGYRDPNKVIQAWAPVMLTASGYQVNHIQDSISTWAKEIKPLIKKLVPDTEPSNLINLFWMSIGTFGTEPHYKSVGSGENSNIITPMSAYIPDGMNETILESLYVGEGIASWMADLSGLSKEWLQVFKNSAPSKAVNAESAPEDPPPPEDDIPF